MKKIAKTLVFDFAIYVSYFLVNLLFLTVLFPESANKHLAAIGGAMAGFVVYKLSKKNNN